MVFLQTILVGILLLENGQNGEISQAQQKTNAELGDQVEQWTMLEMFRPVDDVLVEDMQNL